MFIVATFAIAKKYSNSICCSGDEWLNKLPYRSHRSWDNMQ